jgi:ubiquinone/menaquinone biosynthesis C-methylase UbiE
MPNHAQIYKDQADQYDTLISRQPALLHIIEELKPVKGLDIIDMGAGSGRLTKELAPHAKSILALDTSAEMLIENEKQLVELGLTNWKTQVADHRNIPVSDNSADLILAGWSICYLASSNTSNYEMNIAKIMEEMKRVLRPGGTLIIFETMGTGYESPNPPDFLKPYYSILEDKYGFNFRWIRLDYHFNSLDEAEQLTRFFFGDTLSDRVVKESLIQLPECAGIWWLTI